MEYKQKKKKKNCKVKDKGFIIYQLPVREKRHG